MSLIAFLARVLNPITLAGIILWLLGNSNVRTRGWAVVLIALGVLVGVLLSEPVQYLL